MIRGTTPDLILTVDTDLTGFQALVTFSQGEVRTVLTGDDIWVDPGEVTVIALRLTQEQTLAFKAGTASVEVSYIDETGYTNKTNISSIKVSPTLYDEVIHYAVPD